jgi:hypothetical protein
VSRVVGLTENSREQCDRPDGRALLPREDIDLLRAERRPDVFILDLGIERDAPSTIERTDHLLHNFEHELRWPGISGGEPWKQ